jgi:hypothetical protein
MFQKPTAEQLANRFLHHPPKGDQATRYEQLRKHFLALAIMVVETTPCSAEQTRAVNALDEALYLTIAAIARNE